MFFKLLKKLFFIVIPILIAVALSLTAWLTCTDSGLNALLGLIDKSEFDMPLNIYFGEVHGSLLNGFTVSDITITSGDRSVLPADENGGTGVRRRSILGASVPVNRGAVGYEKLLEIDSLNFGYSISLTGESALTPERVVIEGASAGLSGLTSLFGYAASFGGGGKPILLDFALRSGDIFDIPNMGSLGITELSLSKSGALKLDIGSGSGKFNISADQNISIEDYLELRVNSVDLRAGAGRINLGLEFAPVTTIKADFSGLRISEMLGLFKVSFDADGYTAGSAHVRFPKEGLSASGDLKLNELKISGIPISSFSAPWNFNDKDNVLKFPQIGATMRGMENLKGWAFMNIRDASGAFFLSGEKLSLRDLERTFRLNYPVEGENGSFRAKMEFAPGSISGDISVKIPSVNIEKQKINNVALGVSIKDGAAAGSFKANLLGAPLNGEGRFSLKPPYDVSLKSAISGVESSSLAFFAPEPAAAAIKSAMPKGKIAADIKLNGTLSSIQADGVIKSDKFSLYGLDFRKLSVSFNSSANSKLINYKITSSGGVVLNTSGQINLAGQQISGKGSAAFDAGAVPALSSQMTGRINSDFEISGKFSDPTVSVKLSGKDNSYLDTPVTQTSVSAKYSAGTVNITDSSFRFDSKSFLWLKGLASLRGPDPVLDIKGTVKNFSLENYGMNTRVSGQLKVSGAASNAKITGDFATPAEFSNGDRLNVKIIGTTKSMGFEINDTRIAGGSLNGRGRIEQSGRFLPWVDFDINAVNIRLQELFKSYNIGLPIGGVFTGDIRARRTKGGLSAEILSKFPLTFNKLMVDKLSLGLASVKRGEFSFNAGTLLGDILNLSVNGKITRKKGGWLINLSSNNINMDELMQAAYPSLRGSIAGSVKLVADMDLSAGGKKNYTLDIPDLDAFGFHLNGLRIPFEYNENEIKFKVDRGNLGGALILGEGTVDMKKEKWRALLSMNDIYLEKLVEHLLAPKGGKLTGKGQARLWLNGNFGVMSNVLGFGSFKTSSGALEGLDGMENINKEKRIEFDSVDCEFFFNGKDVIVGDKTSINAPPNDKFYRHIRFSGPLGMGAKNGMRLIFTAKINLDVLNILIGAFEGLVSFAGGGNALLNPAKAVTAKMLGIKTNDFSNVRFNLRGSWGDPVLSDLKLDRQLSAPPVTDNDNDNTERRIDIKVNIPVGPGSSDLSTEDAIKRGIFDGLFDSIVPDIY